ncbi:MAG: dihydrolipoyl dehydrogenase, partial [Candidatus Omnitrophica bacterium]|nr:dihydrolipoyl dehydrogenase [Candidatus Omnitrophota bacterium]
SVVYTHPEIASVGLSEQQALEAGHDIRTGRYPFSANGRARCMNDTEGFVKIIAENKTDRLLGAHIIATHAGDLLQELVTTMAFRGNVEDIALTIHAHPTLSESVKEAALDARGEAVHM